MLFLLLRNVGRTWVRVLPMSVCLGFVVHLAFDLFPRAWSGYALSSMPVYGWLPGWVSIVWISGSVLACAFWSGRLVHGTLEPLILVVGAAGVFIYAVRSENVVLGPLSVAAGALVICGIVSLFSASEQSTRD